ncbi:hypothetical protein CTI12_AA064530 [Artemisia annua]|uniref:CCHC-type domain-containing protein n=1 Tax=Artemisia annua TaxID=35608 RepID=A0A2U1Q7R1_ARTAN|nr:hypothetical protein CTI12_AA064530 [Artemisia annua]
MLGDSEADESNHEDTVSDNEKPKQQQQIVPVANIKLPILKKEEYDIWAMEMEHYLEYIDNDVWKVIQNGNSMKKISVGKDGTVKVLPPVTAAEIHAVEKERKARTILLMAIPKEHLRRFHGMDDAKEIWEVIRIRFGGNANSKKMQKAILKQQFEAFTVSSSEGLEKGYERFQHLLSQLEAHGSHVSTEDANHKFRRSMPQEWINKAKRRVFEQDVKGSSKSSSSAANVAFIGQGKTSTNRVSSGSFNTGSYASSSNNKERDDLAGFADEVLYSLFARRSEERDLIHDDLDQIDDIDMEEMDINWQLAMIALRMNRFFKKTRRNIKYNGNKPVGYDKSKLVCWKCNNNEKERKARTILLMAIPKEHLRRFHGMDDAKEIWEVIRIRFGGNANSKKMQKAILKQQFEAFTVSSSEGLEKGYERFQHLLSQLEAHGSHVSTEDANHKFRRSMPQEWINKAKRRVFEQDVKGSSKSSSSAANVAFVGQGKTSTNKVSSGSFNTGSYASSSNNKERDDLPGFADEVLYSLFARRSEERDLIHDDLDQIDDIDMEEMDINWQLAMIGLRMNRFFKKTRRNIKYNGNKPVGYDKSKLVCWKCNNNGHFARECTVKDKRRSPSRDSDYWKWDPFKRELTYKSISSIDGSFSYKTYKYVDPQTGPKPAQAWDHSLQELTYKDLFDSGCSEHKLGSKEPMDIFERKLDKGGKVWKLTRADGTSECYKNMETLLKSCDREDLDTLWKLVQLDFKNGGRSDVKAQELYVELHRMFAPSSAYVHWSFPSQDKTLLWQLYTISGVHHISIKGGVDIFMLTNVVYPLSTESGGFLVRGLGWDWGCECWGLSPLATAGLFSSSVTNLLKIGSRRSVESSEPLDESLGFTKLSSSDVGRKGDFNGRVDDNDGALGGLIGLLDEPTSCFLFGACSLIRPKYLLRYGRVDDCEHRF